MSESMVSYPYPVFGNGDDVSGEVNQPVVNFAITEEIINFTVDDLSTGNKDIDSLVASGDAAWQMRVHCARTYMRESFIVEGCSWDQKLNAQNYESTVTIEPSVIALKQIENYLPVNSHKDYSGESFSLSVGELLAVANPLTINVDKKYDPLKAPVSSFIKLVEGDHKDGEYKVALDDDIIYVKLSKNDWDVYPGIRDRVPEMLHASLVLPVLTEAIRCVDDHGHTIWAGRLLEIMLSQKIEKDKPLEGAQKLLENPLSRCFEKINQQLDKRGY